MLAPILFSLKAIEFNADGDPRILSFELDGVPARKLDALPEQFLDALAKIASSRLDMLRMVYSIEKMRLGVLESVETDPASYLYDGFIDGPRFQSTPAFPT